MALLIAKKLKIVALKGTGLEEPNDLLSRPPSQVGSSKLESSAARVAVTSSNLKSRRSLAQV